MNTADFKYYWTDSSSTLDSGDGVVISDANFSQVSGPHIESMAEPGQQMSSRVWELLKVARAAYVADKKSLRDNSEDWWTRTIRLSVPVLDPSVWDANKVLVNSLLETLTADRWDVTFRSGGSSSWRRERVFDDWQATDVALFSGGLDSSAFAAHLACRSGGDVLYVMFFEPGTKQQQERVFREIKKVSNRRVHRRDASQMVHGGGRSLERTSRSRGLLYTATAVYCAASHGAYRVLLPENGQLAINLPLNQSRPAACSTRSAHPRTLGLLNQLIARLGANIMVVNPLGNRTKGEVCQLALDAGLKPEALYSTVSCSHPPRNRQGRPPYHCGYCYACLVRRSGLWHALRMDLTDYKCDPWNSRVRDHKAEDLLALLFWLCSPLTSRDLISDLPLPPEVTAASLMPVQQRARHELSEMLGALLPINGPYRGCLASLAA